MSIKYNTWIEIYSIEKHNKGDIMIEESINNLQEYLTHRNPEKYKDFLDGLEKLKIVLPKWYVNEIQKILKISSK